MRKTRPLPYGVFIFLILGFSLPEFACSPKPSSEKIAVQINDHAVTTSEFETLYSEVAPEEEDKESRENFLENLITRKLLLLEAQKQGLDQQKEFLKSIKNFWEQSLLKEVVDKKMAEVSSRAGVSEQEIEKAYRQWTVQNPGSLKGEEEMRETLRWQVIQEKQAQALQEWTDQLRSQAKIQVDRKAIGLE